MNDQFGGHAALAARGDRRRPAAAIKERRANGAAPDHKLTDIKFLPVIPNPEKILCVGINYKSHAAEHGTEAPKLPNIFTKFVNTLVAHEGEMLRPKVSTSFDFEGELALVIGKGGRHIKAADALKHVAGYTCFCDGSVRDFTKYSLVASKNFLGTSPLGPVDGDGGRDPRSDQADAGDAAQRQGDAALRHRHADPFDPDDHRVLLGVHAARRPATSSPPARPTASAPSRTRRCG